jgi:Tol biopolymer transport system component
MYRVAWSIAAALLLSLAVVSPSAQSSSPTLDDLLNLKRVGSPNISPDGRSVAYTLRETNWDDNEFETEIWIASAGAEPRQITSGRKSSSQPAWSPDGKWLAFISDRDGKRQLYRIAVDGGEAERLTNGDDGVNAFAWAPDSERIAFSMTDRVSDSIKEREKQFGDLRIEDEDRRMAHLYVIHVKRTAPTWSPPSPLTKGAFVVGSFDWSPDGRTIAFDHRVSSDPADGGSADISIVTVDSGAQTKVVAQAGPDSNPRWSPDGTRLAFVSSMAKPFFYYANSVIAVVDAREGAKPQSLSDAFDEDPGLIAWNSRGIFFSASQRTATALYRLDPATREILKHQVHDQWIGTGFSFSRDGASVAFVASGPSDFPEVHVAPVSALAKAQKLTNTTGRSHPGRVISAKWFDGRARTARRSKEYCTSLRTSRRDGATRCSL